MHTKGEFLHAVEREVGIESDEVAEHVTKAVLTRLRSRLTTTEARHVEAQLPREVKSLWTGGVFGRANRFVRGQSDIGWAQFLDSLGDDLSDTALDPAMAARGVFHVLKEQISTGEARHVAAQLPADLQKQWENA